MSDHADRSEPLFAGYCHGTLGPAELAELEALIADSRACLARFVDYCELHAQLAWQIRARHEAATPQFRASVAPAIAKSRRGRWHWAYAAMLVCAFGLTMSYLIRVSIRWHQLAAGPRTLCATLTSATGSVIADSGAPLYPGDPLPGGFLRVASGEADIEFYSGAQVTLHGPCEFGVNSANHGFLRSGEVVAFVPPRAHGFTVAAPGCAVVDLGTRFRMSVDRRGRAGVEVIQGRVELQTAGQSQRLVAGTRSEVEPDGRVVVTPIGGSANIVTNGGFESPATTNFINGEIDGWSWNPIHTIDETRGDPPITHGSWCAGVQHDLPGQAAPEGSQWGFLNPVAGGGVMIQQRVGTVQADHLYALSAVMASRTELTLPRRMRVSLWVGDDFGQPAKPVASIDLPTDLRRGEQRTVHLNWRADDSAAFGLQGRALFIRIAAVGTRGGFSQLLVDDVRLHVIPLNGASDRAQHPDNPRKENIP